MDQLLNIFSCSFISGCFYRNELVPPSGLDHNRLENQNKEGHVQNQNKFDCPKESKGSFHTLLL